MSGNDKFASIYRNLGCLTPDSWYEQATGNLPVLLIDHANCEKKAAGTALSLMYRYVDKPVLLPVLSRLAREELRHFEQVHKVMLELCIDYRHITPSRYARELKSLVSEREPDRLVDILLIAAIVEARSCERFIGLSSKLPSKIGLFYKNLAASEARHFETYLNLAETYSVGGLKERLSNILEVERTLVLLPDTEFRFHSGPLEKSNS